MGSGGLKYFIIKLLFLSLTTLGLNYWGSTTVFRYKRPSLQKQTAVSRGSEELRSKVLFQKMKLEKLK